MLFMLAHQLDLFGAAPKPPKKIKVDDIFPGEEFSPARSPNTPTTEEPACVLPEPTEEAADGSIAGAEGSDPLSHFLDEAVVSNDVEWSPEDDEELSYREAFAVENEDAAQSIKAEVLHQAQDAGYDEAEESFGSEPFFGEAETDPAPPPEALVKEAADITAPAENEKAEALTDLAPALKNRREEKEDGLNIPADEELFKRQYYSMRETSAMFGVNQSLLRFWENEFDILQPKKNKKGDRYFRPVDVKNLLLIYNLLRIRKFTLEGAKEYLNRNKKAADTFELTRKLEKVKSFLLELKAGL
jgi:DNA-binding transcriptional MerR regulator